jgi:5,10-methenyltetrahydromethanopterin hydrogenase
MVRARRDGLRGPRDRPRAACSAGHHGARQWSRGCEVAEEVGGGAAVVAYDARRVMVRARRDGLRGPRDRPRAACSAGHHGARQWSRGCEVAEEVGGGARQWSRGCEVAEEVGHGSASGPVSTDRRG